ncbi:FGFR1 oncogene partner 2 homolog [Anneissia japonica]|uniref:FGFR1 oncogene partner 2 homolog n=1 Tax=Anneissia japonica TaxID=1529436 RepID=UPI0014255E0F|nr:FGFR1 oncogene partner 2 homolog [Anneissia japonica]
MSLTVEQVLNDAKRLVERLREHDNAADTLIEQTTTLHKKIDAMKQYQEEVEEMNQVARHRPRSSLILGIQQENRQIRELQRENKDLRLALDEHQSALELIMSSYREQVSKLVMANRTEKVALTTNMPLEKSQETEISSTMQNNNMDLDEKAAVAMEEMMARLLIENRGLREMLEISRRMHNQHTKILEDNENSKDDNKNVKEKNDNETSTTNFEKK